MDNRRVFLRKMGLAGVALTGMPSLIAPFKSQCADKEKDTGNGAVFLFQGDSITDGNRGRNLDPNHIMGHGYAFSIASRLGADFPSKKFVFYNRGISGNKVTDLAARWQHDTLDLKPSVLSILIGVNDAGARIKDGTPTIVEFDETYNLLLDQTRAQFPDITFVLCQPFLLPVGNVKNKWELFYPEIQKEQAIVERLAKTYNAVYVQFQKVMDNACRSAEADYWMWDGVHPTVAGHELLAREWIRTVSKRLPFLG
ncbi:MAG: SGNH/GDSL hydrolase family protein [Agriterribacter sp.]